MSSSPPIRRSFSLSRTSSHSSSKHEEDLINAYEAEQERIMNVLSRKLEQLRNEKVDLENALEAENESHVLRLQRELAALRAQQIAQQSQADSESPSAPVSPVVTSQAEGVDGLPSTASPIRTASDLVERDGPTPNPSMEAMLDALRRENETLRTRLVDTERDYIRVTRLNDTYREELLDHRRRLNLPTDSLLSSAPGALSQSPPLSPLSPFGSHPRSRAGSLSQSQSRSNSYFPQHTTRALSIPPSSSASHHPRRPSGSEPSPTLDSSSSSSTSAFASLLSSLPESRATPSSSPSLPYPFPMHPPAPFGLTYPSVPPPSLSSSVGSGAGSRRGSIGAGRGASREGRRVVETGTLKRNPSAGGASGSQSIGGASGSQGIGVAGA